MTRIRCATPASTPRSWVMSSSAVPRSSHSATSSSRICAWIVTSSAVVGSSATTSSGSHASAIAIIARWRMPPEKRCGYSSTLRSGVRDADLARAARPSAARAAARSQPMCAAQRLGDLVADRQRRVQRAQRVLEDRPDVAAAQRAARGRVRAPDVAAREAHAAGDRAPTAGAARSARAPTRSCPSPTRRPCRRARRRRSRTTRRARPARGPAACANVTASPRPAAWALLIAGSGPGRRAGRRRAG